MRDHESVRFRPRDLAAVWGTALEQLVDLWRAGLVSLLEAGSGAANVSSGHGNEIRVPTVGGRAPRLIARNLIGESFGRSLDGRAVIFTVKGPGGPGVVLVDCRVEESRAEQIQGDVYRGEVVDEQGVLIARIALDAGS